MAITKRALRIRQEKMQAQCDAWNAKHPVGTPVVVKLDGRDEPHATTTTSTAQILSGHTVVIWLEGVSGCYHMTHVRAASTTQEREAAAADLKKKLLAA